MNKVKSPSVIDIEYFNQFINGYNPYADLDIDITVGELVKTIEANKMRRLQICEVGSASGQFSKELARRLDLDSVLFFGMDIAEQVLAFYPFHKICGSAFQMPVPDHAFNIICYPASLHHLAPFSVAVAEMSRVLAPGGLMYCVEPNFFHPHRRFFMQFQSLYHLYRKANDTPIDPYQLESLLQSHGLRVINLHYINLRFRKPSILQKAQNFVASLNTPSSWDKFILPWFILTAVKDKDN